jgi:hypothetical protein
VLTNGARASRAFWQVNGAGANGGNADFAGTLMGSTRRRGLHTRRQADGEADGRVSVLGFVAFTDTVQAMDEAAAALVLRSACIRCLMLAAT